MLAHPNREGRAADLLYGLQAVAVGATQQLQHIACILLQAAVRVLHQTGHVELAALQRQAAAGITGQQADAIGALPPVCRRPPRASQARGSCRRRSLACALGPRRAACTATPRADSAARRRLLHMATRTAW